MQEKILSIIDQRNIQELLVARIIATECGHVLEKPKNYEEKFLILKKVKRLITTDKLLSHVDDTLILTTLERYENYSLEDLNPLIVSTMRSLLE